MAVTLARLGRFLRSIFAPATAIISFSCILTFIFVLYQPHAGPGALQRLGWQSWDSISDIGPGVGSTGSQAPQDETEVGDIEVPSSGDFPEGVDWWNVAAPDNGVSVDPTSLPLDIWDPLMPHDTGLTEIDIKQCLIDSYFIPSVGTLCGPSTSKEQDSLKGKWVQVDRNLNFQGYSFVNVYYRRTRRLDIPLITDIRILPEKETPSPFSSQWSKVSRPVSPRGETLYLWYYKNKTLSEMSNAEKQNNLITEIDVTYGDSDAWYGFEKLERPVASKDEGKKLESVWLTTRKGVQPPPRAGPLHFSHDGKFKIMQIADLHFSVNQGVCRETIITPCTAADDMSISLLADTLDKEKPDLVVFSGDQLNGQGTSWDAKSVLAKFARAVTDRQIPWAAIFGNHDDEDGDTRAEQIKYMQGLPYSLVQAGPKDIHGVGNYLHKVYSADPSKTHILTLYFLDSGAYGDGKWDFFNIFTPTEYDWIHQDQIDWFLEESYGSQDLGSIWNRDDQFTPQTRLAKPNALMFFHIPLEEAYSMADKDPKSGAFLDLGLHDLEGHGNSKRQDGFFQKGLLKAMESDHSSGNNAREVKVVANGHCHVTENCRRVKGIWNCFGGGGSYSGYGKIGFDRRFRIFDISDFGETIRTYKHTEHMPALNPQILSGHGAAPPYEGP
ncbi:hypothetical protein EW026_g7427 [Hermanssonia centrifuga]|uniref:Calcineurin-like phosphoesterase domain-containing protein n=1 Tax=Hermanssonia centrifuga TaxID=98765 RepID=A0A4S4K7U5_9APHY|nr:hypothetical protein EW026_g7427 [Hermanssonia centrifuga]